MKWLRLRVILQMERGVYLFDIFYISKLRTKFTFLAFLWHYSRSGEIVVQATQMHNFNCQMHNFEDQMHNFKDQVYSFNGQMHSFKGHMHNFQAQRHNVQGIVNVCN
jgi:hypothetical protein